MIAPKELELKFTCECCEKNFKEGACIPNDYTGKIYLCPDCFTRAVEIVMVNSDIRPAIDIIKEDNLSF